MADSIRPPNDGRTPVQPIQRPQEPAQPVTPTGPPPDPNAPEDPADADLHESPRRSRPPSRHGRRFVPPDTEHRTFSPEQRLLILDAWLRSGLPAGDFAPVVGLSRHTLYSWEQRFEQHGPAGLLDQPQGALPGSKLPELTKRTILLVERLPKRCLEL